MRSKLSVDLSRPLVSSMGQHDPLDGWVTCEVLEAGGPDLLAEPSPSLREVVLDFASMLEPDALATGDSLGIGGLLVDVCRLAQIDRRTSSSSRCSPRRWPVSRTTSPSRSGPCPPIAGSRSGSWASPSGSGVSRGSRRRWLRTSPAQLPADVSRGALPMPAAEGRAGVVLARPRAPRRAVLGRACRHQRRDAGDVPRARGVPRASPARAAWFEALDGGRATRARCRAQRRSAGGASTSGTSRGRPSRGPLRPRGDPCARAPRSRSPRRPAVAALRDSGERPRSQREGGLRARDERELRALEELHLHLRVARREDLGLPWRRSGRRGFRFRRRGRRHRKRQQRRKRGILPAVTPLRVSVLREIGRVWLVVDPLPRVRGAPARDARTSGAWRVSRSATSPTRSTTARAAPLQPPAHATVERRSRPSSCTRRPSHQAHGMASSGGLTRWSGRGRISTRLIFCERLPPAEPSFVRESAMKTSTGGLRASIARAVVAAALTLGAACATLGTVPEQDTGADSAVESRVDATSGDARNGGRRTKMGARARRWRGSSCSPSCAPGQPCGSASDCSSGLCTSGTCAVGCAPSCPDGHSCASGADCATNECMSGTCAAPSCGPSCPDGHLCGANGDCSSGACVANHCSTPSCSPSCGDGQTCGAGSDCSSATCTAVRAPRRRARPRARSVASVGPTVTAGLASARAACACRRCAARPVRPVRLAGRATTARPTSAPVANARRRRVLPSARTVSGACRRRLRLGRLHPWQVRPSRVRSGLHDRTGVRAARRLRLRRLRRREMLRRRVLPVVSGRGHLHDGHQLLERHLHRRKVRVTCVCAGVRRRGGVRCGDGLRVRGLHERQVCRAHLRAGLFERIRLRRGRRLRLRRVHERQVRAARMLADVRPRDALRGERRLRVRHLHERGLRRLHGSLHHGSHEGGGVWQLRHRDVRVQASCTWGTPSSCTGGGACAPAATQTCNTYGTETCSSSCAWGGARAPMRPSARRARRSPSHAETAARRRTPATAAASGSRGPARARGPASRARPRCAIRTARRPARRRRAPGERARAPRPPNANRGLQSPAARAAGSRSARPRRASGTRAGATRTSATPSTMASSAERVAELAHHPVAHGLRTELTAHVARTLPLGSARTTSCSRRASSSGYPR